MSNLKALDEAANLSITKGKKSLRANVTFCRFLGIVFILVGVFHLMINGMAFLGPDVFLCIFGAALIIGAQVYASALKDN